MTEPRPPLKEINPAVPPVPLDAEARAEIAALASRQRRANGLLMRVISYAGGQVEDGMKMLPAGARGQIEGAARTALTRSYEIAARSRAELPVEGPLGGAVAAALGALSKRVTTDRAHRVLATMTGALGGVGGLPTALAELPIATTLIFRAVQGVAAANGEDPEDAATRIECLRVFGAGGPGAGDDGIDTSFIGARLGLSGAAVGKMIGRIAPRFAAVLSQKLAAQAVPVLGAAAGAGTNYAFVGFYTEMAHVHFGLRRLARRHGEEQVLDEFHRKLAEGRIPPLRG